MSSLEINFKKLTLNIIQEKNHICYNYISPNKEKSIWY